MHFYWQNLNEDPRGKVKGWPYHGRAWLHLTGRLKLYWSWNFWTSFCHVRVDSGRSDNDWTLALAFPPVAFWVGIEGLPRWMVTDADRVTGVSIHDWTLWIELWTDRWGWKRGDRKWSFNFRDFILGKPTYADETFSTREVVIPMPEGTYLATLRMYEGRWARPRWFTKRISLASVDIPGGIPHAGKGENSWDCGEDATYGLSCQATAPEEAIGKTVESVLRDRRRYDGNLMAKYPPPEVRAAKLKRARKRNSTLHPGGAA